MTNNKQLRLQDLTCMHPIFRTRDEHLRDGIMRLKNGYKHYYGPALTNEIGCWLAQKARHNGFGTGYIRIRLGKERYEYYAHHVSVAYYKNKVELALVYRAPNEKEYQVSHLCHNSICFNPDHLIVEPAEINRARNTCSGHHALIQCPCPCEYRFSRCTHNPKCILP